MYSCLCCGDGAVDLAIGAGAATNDLILINNVPRLHLIILGWIRSITPGSVHIVYVWLNVNII